MLLCVVLVMWIGSVYATDCPDGWSAFEGSCYLFDDTPADFTEAVLFCSQRHSHLVRVETAEENSYLKGLLRDSHSMYWLGMTDKTVEGFWRWFVDDSLVGFTDWGYSEPDNKLGSEDCAVFDVPHNLQWADVLCSRRERPLCEMRPSGEIIG